MSYFTKFALLTAAPIVAFADFEETPSYQETIEIPESKVVIPNYDEPAKARNTFVEFNPLSLSIGGGIRYDVPDTLKANEHSIRYTPGFSRDFWGILTYKYARLTYDDPAPYSNYKGIGFKLGLIHKQPFPDIQLIRGWRFESGPFKWGQLEVNCLPLAITGLGLAIMADGNDWGIGSAVMVAGIATAVSFNLAF